MAESRLNPQVRQFPIGVKELREVTVYPLSMSDQLDLTDVIIGGMEQFGKTEDLKDEAVVENMLTLIRDNLAKILDLIIPEQNVTLKELTNQQFTDLALLVYEVNYEGAVKNVQSLVKKVKAVFHREQPKVTS